MSGSWCSGELGARVLRTSIPNGANGTNQSELGALHDAESARLQSPRTGSQAVVGPDAGAVCTAGSTFTIATDCSGYQARVAGAGVLSASAVRPSWQFILVYYVT